KGEHIGYKKSFFSAAQHPRLIYNMVFDRDGFLWLGGDRLRRTAAERYGLMRYDGDRFHAIKLPDYGNGNEGVIGITKMKAGSFYLRCWGKGYQLLTMNPQTVEFRRVVFPGFHNSLFRLSRVFSNRGKNYTIVQDS